MITGYPPEKTRMAWMAVWIGPVDREPGPLLWSAFQIRLTGRGFKAAKLTTMLGEYHDVKIPEVE